MCFPAPTILAKLRLICNVIISKHLLGQLTTHRGKSWHAKAQGTLKYECHTTPHKTWNLFPPTQTPKHQTRAQARLQLSSNSVAPGMHLSYRLQRQTIFLQSQWSCSSFPCRANSASWRKQTHWQHSSLGSSNDVTDVPEKPAEGSADITNTDEAEDQT